MDTTSTSRLTNLFVNCKSIYVIRVKLCSVCHYFICVKNVKVTKKLIKVLDFVYHPITVPLFLIPLGDHVTFPRQALHSSPNPLTYKIAKNVTSHNEQYLIEIHVQNSSNPSCTNIQYLFNMNLFERGHD